MTASIIDPKLPISVFSEPLAITSIIQKKITIDTTTKIKGYIKQSPFNLKIKKQSVSITKYHQNIHKAILAQGFPLIADIISTRDKKSTLKPNRWHKINAYRYFSVDWSKYDDSLKPPYKIWRAKEGFIEITEETFKQW